MTETIKVADIGSGPESVAHVNFENATITRVDINPAHEPDLLHDITQPFPAEYHGQFDIVFCSHVMEHLPYVAINPTMENLVALLKDNGEIWLIFPSMEWVGEQFHRLNYGEYPSPVIMGVVCGSQETEADVHRSIWWIDYARRLLRKHGCITRRAFTSNYSISTKTMGSFEVVQDVVIGAKLAVSQPLPEEVIDGVHRV